MEAIKQNGSSRVALSRGGHHQADWFVVDGVRQAEWFCEWRSVVVETIKQNGLSWMEYIKQWYGASGAAVLLIK
eukprot:3463733-Heterocapsa_arctica.AAC.1